MLAGNDPLLPCREAPKCGESIADDRHTLTGLFRGFRQRRYWIDYVTKGVDVWEGAGKGNIANYLTVSAVRSLWLCRE